MICVRTQMFTNNHRLLWNSPSWRQFKIRSASQGRISLLVYYFFFLLKNRVKLLQEELKKTLFHLLNEYSIYLFIDLNLVTRAEAVTSVSA